MIPTPFTPIEPDDEIAAGPRDARGPRIREIPLRLLIPNVITVLALCAGLTGVRLAFENRFETAVTLVLFAALLDGVDGRVARRLKASSKFGAEMDSLADVVNFGVAPALVLYAYLLDQARGFGWIAALLFAIACGLRLARFNVMDSGPARPAWQNDYFTGVPAPMGAALVLLPAYLGFIGVEVTRTFAFASAAYTVIVALLLISRLPVYSGKSASARIRGDLVMPLLLASVAYVALLANYTWETMTATVALYLLSLPIGARAYFRRLKADEAAVAAPPSAEIPE